MTASTSALGRRAAGGFGTALAITAIIALLFPGHSARGAQASTPLSNGDVLAMVHAGITQEVILAKIAASPTNFDTTTEALAALQKAGIRPEIIKAMMNPANADASHPRRAAGSTSSVTQCETAPGGRLLWLTGTSPAMWLLSAANEPDAGTEINYERGTVKHVGWGAFGTSLLELHPLRAQLRLRSPARFASCINPSEAPLVRFSLDRGSDERNTSLGRVTPWSHSISISQEDLVPTHYERMPDGRYEVTPNAPLAPGEYGFVPQASLGYFALGERVYTFGVD